MGVMGTPDLSQMPDLSSLPFLNKAKSILDVSKQKDRERHGGN
jgi:hypothetical protein